jgi:hypothetical protein
MGTYEQALDPGPEGPSQFSPAGTYPHLRALHGALRWGSCGQIPNSIRVASLPNFNTNIHKELGRPPGAATSPQHAAMLTTLESRHASGWLQ